MSYALMKLPCHNRLIQVFPDTMHTIKDAVEHVFNIITGAEDSVKVRNAEALSTLKAGLNLLSVTEVREEIEWLPYVSFVALISLF